MTSQNPNIWGTAPFFITQALTSPQVSISPANATSSGPVAVAPPPPPPEKKEEIADCIMCKKRYKYFKLASDSSSSSVSFPLSDLSGQQSDDLGSAVNKWTCSKKCFIAFRKLLGISDRWYPAPGEDVKQFYLNKDGSNGSDF